MNMKKLIIVFLTSFLLLISFLTPHHTSAIGGCPGSCEAECVLPKKPMPGGICTGGQICCALPGVNLPDSGGSTADLQGNCGEDAIDTAIGCINVLGGPEAFIGDLLKWGIGVGGGIAFLLIVYASFMIMTSSGNPERLKAGQELMTSAISGVVLLVLSVFVLNLIGVEVLKLDQFGFNQ